MKKKTIRITESELKRIVENSITRVLKEQCEDYPHSDDIFDLDKIPIEDLDRGYVRYEPYNLSITYRHPLRGITENAEFKRKVIDAKRIILLTYPLTDKQFIISKGYNGMYAAILASLVENNVDVIEEAMAKLGFFRSRPTDEKLLVDRRGRKWIDLRFEPTPSNDLTNYVRKNYRYVYHLAPSIFEEGIKENGLIPSNKNSEFKYNEPRVYLMKGTAAQKSIQELVNELYQQAKQRGYSNLTPQYSLFVIDLSKIDNNVRFYGDINEKEGLFITSPILPNSFAKIEKITAKENES